MGCFVKARVRCAHPAASMPHVFCCVFTWYCYLAHSIPHHSPSLNCNHVETMNSRGGRKTLNCTGMLVTRCCRHLNMVFWARNPPSQYCWYSHHHRPLSFPRVRCNLAWSSNRSRSCNGHGIRRTCGTNRVGCNQRPPIRPAFGCTWLVRLGPMPAELWHQIYCGWWTNRSKSVCGRIVDKKVWPRLGGTRRQWRTWPH